ncbi:MAG: hypothetical protein Q8R28_02360 [Dehalococcoidia bacterium]|nr:hypothetical protein [Dehalococcoidia bacterium]
MSDGSQRHRRKTEWQLVTGGFALVVIIGGALMWRIYGTIFALIGMGVAVTGIAIFGLLWGLLRLLEAWSKSE